MKNKLIIFSALLFLFSNRLYCGDNAHPVKEEQLWLLAGLKYHQNEHLWFEFYQKAKFHNPYNDLNEYMPAIGAGYNISSLFYIDLFYRYKFIPGFETSTQEIMTDFTLKPKINKFVFDNRLRFHIKFPKKFSSLYYIRYRFTLKYKYNKTFTPFIFSEIFYMFNQHFSDFYESRLGLGFKMKIDKHNSLKLFYLYKTLHNLAIKPSINAVGLYYIYEL